MIAEEYEILQLEWDYRIVQDQSGKKKKIIRGIDYDTTCINLSEVFAKRGNEITSYNERKFSNLYKTTDFETFEFIQSYNATTNYFKDKNNVHIDRMVKELRLIKSTNIIGALENKVNLKWKFSDEAKEKHTSILRAKKEKAIIWTLSKSE